MNEHTIVNGIFAVIAIAVFAVRAFRKVAASPAAANGPARTPAIPAGIGSAPATTRIRRQPIDQPATAPTGLAERPAAAPRTPFAPAGEAFSMLDLTLPDAAGAAQPVPAPRRGRSMLGTGAPGSAGWGAGAIVALEILGPPVSLRPGATLGAPHAF